MTLILTNDEVARVFDMRRSLELLEDAYRELGEGRAVIRPRVHSFMDSPVPGAGYMFKSMEGGLERLGVMALRIASEHSRLVEIYGKLRSVQLPAPANNKFLGLVLLFSTETTEPLAIMPDGYIQSQRVGATWALGAKYLAREDCATIGLYGSGQQAPAFLEAHCLVRPKVKLAKVYSPTKEHREGFAQRMSKKLDLEVLPVEDPREVMRNADMVLEATTAREPVVRGEWAEPGMHACCISPGQMDKAFYNKVDVWVAHHRMTALDVRTQDAPSARQRERFVLEEEKYQSVATLADLVCGRAPGRTDDAQITYFGGMTDPQGQGGFGSSGTGIQFAALGYEVYSLAKEMGLGREVPTDWFLQDLHP